jgi:hypothetical protein
MEKIKGYVIDPESKAVYPVELHRNHLPDYQQWVGAKEIASVSVFHGNLAYIDANSSNSGKAPFIIPDEEYKPRLVFGRALILGSCEHGKDQSCGCSIDEMQHYTVKLQAVWGDGQIGLVAIDKNDPSFEIWDRQQWH